MVEYFYSPLSPVEVYNVLGNSLSSVPRASDWEIFPQQPDGFFYGEISIQSFYLSPASIHEKGHPTLEIFGVIMPIEEQKSGSYIEIRYRPGSFKLLVWTFMLILFIVFIALVLLNFFKTGELNSIIIFLVFGLLALTSFGLIIYRRIVANSHHFLKKALLLQEVSPDE